MAIKFGAKQLISYDPQQSSENITDTYISFVRSLMSFPLNIPGTNYHKSMKDRKKAMNMIRKVLKQRLASPEQHHGDILDHVIQDMNALDFLTMDFV
ncbi:cucurbitadienol 11-hydroxylase-like, partial [Fagus crenata]